MATKEVDYLALARTRAHTTATRQSYRRFMFYARNKKGKTKLLMSAGRDEMLIVDPEQGTDLHKAADPFVWPVTKWDDMQEVWGACRTGKLSPNHIKQGESSTPDRKSTRLNSSHCTPSRMPSSA